jgi:signal transduction histidine kinase
MESSSHSIIIVDMQNRIIEMNRTAEMTLDYPISRAIGRNVKEVMTVISGALKALEENTGEPSEITMQTGKTQRCYLVYSSTLQDRNKKPIGRLISLVDNTEYRRMEEHRKELESRSQMLSRLSTVGEMAAGIAHEVNNPLATVIGYTDLLLKQDLPESVKDDLHIIDRGAKRAAGILERLLTFSGKQNAERDFVDINRIMETAIEFRKHFLKDKNIEVIEEFDTGLPGTIADSGQLLEVFLNLILNAESSIIRAGNPGFIKIITGTAGDNIVISFEDNGTGVSQENLDKIFNPFFTTKKVSEGSGLGLSICHGIITSHGGDISVTNNSPRGATFVITLPVVKYSTCKKQGK